MEGLSSKMIKLIETIHHKKRITRKESGISTLSYYVWTRLLREKDIIKLNGINDNNQHMYELTTKGNRIAELLIELRELLKENNN